VKKIIQYSRTFAMQVQMPWNQADAPLLLLLLLIESFPKRPRMRSEASQFSGSHWYKQNKTKQTNKQPSFIDSSAYAIACRSVRPGHFLLYFCLPVSMDGWMDGWRKYLCNHNFWEHLEASLTPAFSFFFGLAIYSHIKIKKR